MSRLKVGVIGCGSIAIHRHLPEYENNESVEIVAVCDVVEQRAKVAAKRYGGKVYTDYEALLSDDNIEAISICLPNYLHAPVSISASHAGKHVLCEKPMAMSSEEAQAMIQAAESNAKKLMIGHNQRFIRSHEKAKALIAAGKLGKIYSFRTAFGHPGPEDWSIDGQDSWFFNKDEAFIGAMGDLGVHKTDLIRYVLGEEIVEVGGFVEANAKSDIEVDDNAVCILKTESGIIGTLAASWAYTTAEDNSTIIYGEKGILRLENDPTYSLIASYTNGEVVNYELGAIQTNEAGGQHNTHVIDHFVSAILNDTEVPVPGEEGKKSLEVVLGALESSKNKTIVKL